MVIYLQDKKLIKTINMLLIKKATHYVKNQKFGVEIEMTGITRATAAQIVGEVLGSQPSAPTGNCYYTRQIKDQVARVWKVMRDSSINPIRNDGTNAAIRETFCLNLFELRIRIFLLRICTHLYSVKSFLCFYFFLDFAPLRSAVTSLATFPSLEYNQLPGQLLFANHL